MDIVARECSFVTGRTAAYGGAGDSSVLTAFGVFQGMRAAAGHVWGSTSLRGRRVGIEGVGKVGRKLAGHLTEDGAEVVICDVSEAAVESVRALHPGVEVAAGTKELLAAGLDVFSPCALGGAVDDDVAATVSAGIICGGANNQLAHAGVEKILADRGILYAPDYVVNAGGVIQVADERGGFSFERAKARAEHIFGTTTRIFEIADTEGVPSSAAADRLAEQRMSDVGRLRGIWLGG